jgi:hypothetical protein
MLISFQIFPVLFKKQRPDLPAEISILMFFKDLKDLKAGNTTLKLEKIRS